MRRGEHALEWWQAFILGLVEGITEYLPVSSTGHLILASALMGLDDPSVKANVDAFNIVIQGGAILAVLGLYWPRILRMINGLLGKDPAGRKLFLNILIAFLPAAVLGVLLDDWIEARLFSTWPVLAALALGGVYMIALDRWKVRPMREADASGDEARAGKELDQLTWQNALTIGFLQCVAMWPGTSRSMMTITGGVLVGLRPRAAAEFSFLLGLPTLGGACVYKLAKNIQEARETNTENLFQALGVMPVIVGMAVATVSAVLAVKWLVGFLNKHGLAAFGWYRLVLTLALGGAIAGGVVTLSATEPPPSDSIEPIAPPIIEAP